MSTTSDITADLEAVRAAIAAGRPVDPEIKKRVHARAEKIREEILKKHGVLNVAVDLVRESRDE